MKRRQSDDRYPGDYGGYDDQGYDRYDGGYDDSYDDGSGFQDLSLIHISEPTRP